MGDFFDTLTGTLSRPVALVVDIEISLRFTF